MFGIFFVVVVFVAAFAIIAAEQKPAFVRDDRAPKPLKRFGGARA